MCGIYCSLNQHQHTLPSEATLRRLKRRGPDSYLTIRRVIRGHSGVALCYLTLCSSVLSLRGDHITRQPLQDPFSESLLCWNGEAWKFKGNEVEGNDAQLVFKLLLEAAKGTSSAACAARVDPETSLFRIGAVLSRISGPFAFVFYDSRTQRIFFGRDILGRRALLTTVAGDGSILISSVCDQFHSANWEEVEADGLRVLDLDRMTNLKHFDDDRSQGQRPVVYKPMYIPWSPRESNGSFSENLVYCSYVMS